MSIKFVFAVIVAASAKLACAAGISVAVAANVQYAFEDLKAAFRQESGHEVRATYNSSGKFVAQIANGAPYDVFLSADMEFPEKLHRDGFTGAAPRIYAYGALVLWSTRDLDLAQWRTSLTGNKVKRIALANPRTAPYGRESLRVLQHFKLDQTLQPKLVFGESIAQTNQYIHAGVADAGFTAKAVVLAPEMRGQGHWIDMPTEAYQPIAQGAVLLRHGMQNNSGPARQFYDFLYSDKARAIFKRYGYLLP